MVELIVLPLLLGAVTYRVARFLLLDTMIDGSRDKAIEFLDKRSDKVVYRKLLELFTCPYCITVWVAAGSVAVTRLFVGPLPMPVWLWLGAATVSLLIWAVIDPE